MPRHATFARQFLQFPFSGFAVAVSDEVADGGCGLEMAVEAGALDDEGVELSELANPISALPAPHTRGRPTTRSGPVTELPAPRRTIRNGRFPSSLPTSRSSTGFALTLP